MVTKDQLAEGYALNLRLIEMQTAGLSHADSLIQTPYNINYLNWVLGHIAVGRDSVLRLVCEETLLNEAEVNCYKTDSQQASDQGYRKGNISLYHPIARPSMDNRDRCNP
jgi:hypothetical protein